MEKATGKAIGKANAHGPVIEPKLRELDKKLTKLRVDTDLYTIIHQPGWTTLIDVHFVNTAIEAMAMHADALQHHLDALSKGSKMILADSK